MQALFNDTGSTLAHVKSGALKALAFAMPKRVATFPDLPTLVDLGCDVQVPVWIALGTVAGTPPAAIARLNEALKEAMQAAEFSGKMAEIGVVVTRAPARRRKPSPASSSRTGARSSSGGISNWIELPRWTRARIGPDGHARALRSGVADGDALGLLRRVERVGSQAVAADRREIIAQRQERGGAVDEPVAG